MRKYLVLLMILSILALAACGKLEINTGKPVVNEENKTENEPNNDETVGNEQGLKLQVLQGDEEIGVTVENNQFYSELDKVIQQYPNMGAKNDFTVYIVNAYRDDSGNPKLVLLGINRLPVAIKNIEFIYTLGNKNNEYVWERQPIEMTEEKAGVLQPNSALPIVLSITEEQLELLKSLEEDNKVMTIDGFTYEEVK
ncbi:hypothetical protein JSQ81_05205 [Sporosarcina sp. Marseille-Q4063]|uniref:hypothetical protein n=1 Tax=Sporosarcina sp. Marseille-Q4063 TaxID=2810514 RepID=UPI001BAF0191|nr:hypothetical protein [Sporosarcina sp. Marseille-Q4063]QUW22974.1 hypothetical protein JSQ81_05205 [Sporosarcina sp. Marseille-Q4063]